MYTSVPCGAGAGAGGPAAATISAALKFFVTAQCALTDYWPPDIQLTNGSCFDFVVVGGGTAGATLAARLSERSQYRVLLLEAGGDPPLDSIIPAFSASIRANKYDWNFTTVSDGVSSQALVDGRQLQPRGKMLGGTGSMNDMVYARGFPADYDEWAESLGDDWNWTNVLEYFKKTEILTDERIVNDPELMTLHGRQGEIEVSGLNESTPDTDVLLKAFQEVGFPKVRDMTNIHKIGVGRHSHTIRNGRRDSSLTALLNKAVKKNKNLFVLKNAFVHKVLISNHTAYGVKVKIDNDEYNFFASKEVIVSAGTFNTPKLLMLSGIGPREHLKDMNIDVVQDLPVGDNLHDHVMVLNYMTADRGTCEKNQQRAHWDIIRYLYDQTGSFSNINTMAAYLSLTNSTPNVPDFAFYPSCTPAGTDFYESCVNLMRLQENICQRLHGLLIEKELFTIAAVLMKPKSRGTVRLKSKLITDDPLIYSGTFSDDIDLDGYPQALEIVRKIANTTYFRSKNAKIVELDIENCRLMEGVEAVKCKTRAVAMSAWHSVGTAAMGAVVDSRLRVRGVTRLRVADASVMPKVVRGNTNAPVVMIAEKTADFIKSDLSRSL